MALLALVCAASAAGCGSAEQLPAIRLDAPQPGAAAPDAALVVLRFVQAARHADAVRMWALLSLPTRQSIGPTLAAFARGKAPELTESLEDFRGGRVLLSRRLDAVWAVAAVSGRFEQNGGESEPAAYAAALRRERGAWKVELDGLVITRLRPGPLERVGERPEVRAEAQAGSGVRRLLLWLDGRAAGVGYARTSPFSAELQGRPAGRIEPGEHTLVAFAATAETAAALAWTFEVDG